GRKRALGHHAHGDVLPGVVRLEGQGDGQLPGRRGRGVGVQNVLQDFGDLIVRPLLDGTPGHLQNGLLRVQVLTHGVLSFQISAGSTSCGFPSSRYSTPARPSRSWSRRVSPTV